MLHHEIGQPVFARPGVEDLGDARVAHERERLALRLEPRQHLFRVHPALDELESHAPPSGCSCSARKTTPMPPLPRTDSRWYGPIRSGTSLPITTEAGMAIRHRRRVARRGRSRRRYASAQQAARAEDAPRAPPAGWRRSVGSAPAVSVGSSDTYWPSLSVKRKESARGLLHRRSGRDGQQVPNLRLDVSRVRDRPTHLFAQERAEATPQPMQGHPHRRLSHAPPRRDLGVGRLGLVARQVWLEVGRSDRPSGHRRPRCRAAPASDRERPGPRPARRAPPV